MMTGIGTARRGLTLALATLLAVAGLGPLTASPASAVLPTLNRNAILQAAIDAVANHIQYSQTEPRLFTSLAALKEDGSTDCSGLVYFAYAQSGIPLHGRTATMIENVPGKDPGDFVQLGPADTALPGDVIFYGTKEGFSGYADYDYWEASTGVKWDVGHVTIFAGNAKMYEAGSPLKLSPVRTTNGSDEEILGYFRIKGTKASGVEKYFGFPDGRYASGTWLLTDDQVPAHADTDGMYGGSIYFVVGDAKYYVSWPEFLAIDWAAWGRTGAPDLPPTDWAAIDDLRDAPRDGTFIRDARGENPIYQVIGGAMHHVAEAEWPTLLPANWTNVPASVLSRFTLGGIPSFEGYLRDPVSGAIYQVTGGERFHLSPVQYRGLGTPSVINAPMDFIDNIPLGVPYGPTVVRDATTTPPTFYQVVGGAKIQLTAEMLAWPEYASLLTSDDGYTTEDPSLIAQISDGAPQGPLFLRSISEDLIDDGEQTYQAVYHVIGEAKIHLTEVEYAALGHREFIDVPLEFIQRVGDGAPQGYTYLRDPLNFAIYQITDGQRVHLSPAQWAARPAGAASVDVAGRMIERFPEAIPVGPTYVRNTTPNDSVILPDAIYQVLGGVKTRLYPNEYAALDYPSYSQASADVLKQIPDATNLTPPRDVPYLRDKVTGAIYEVRAGAKYHMTPSQWAAAYASGARYVDTLRRVIALIPDGVPEGPAYLRNITGRDRDIPIYSICQVMGGARYCLSPTEYAALGYPAYSNVSASTLKEYTNPAPISASLPYLRDKQTLAIYQVVDGKKYQLTGVQYVALGKPAFVDTVFGFIDLIDDGIPQGPTYLRNNEVGDVNRYKVYEVLGGSKYWVDLATYQSLGSPQYVDTPVDILNQIPDVAPNDALMPHDPVTGAALVRDPVSGAVFQVLRGAKFHLLTGAEWSALDADHAQTIDAPVGFINLITGAIPTGSFLAQDVSTREYYQVSDGTKWLLPDYVYDPMNSPDVATMASGWLAAIPDFDS